MRMVELRAVFIPVWERLKLRVSPLLGVSMNLEFEDMNDISEPDWEPFIEELFVPYISPSIAS